MNINKAYKKAYQLKEKLFWANPHNHFSAISAPLHLNVIFGERLERDLENIVRHKFPRLKKIDSKVILKRLTEDEINEVKEKWQKRGLRFYDQKIKQFMLVFDWLFDNASNVSMENEDRSGSWHFTYKSDFGTYSTQTGPERYAMGNVKIKADILTANSIPFEIKSYVCSEETNWENVLVERDGSILVWDEEAQQIVPRKGHSSYGWRSSGSSGEYHKYAKGYILHSPLKPYQLYALEARSGVDTLQWAVNCWKNGMNPKVLNPFLSDDLYDKSSEVVYGEK